MAKKHSLLHQLYADGDTTGWVAVVLGLLVLLFLFRPKPEGAPQGRAAPLAGGATAGTAGGKPKIHGWKVLLCVHSVQDAASEAFALCSEQLDVLRKVAQHSNLHVVAMVSNDAEEEAVRSALTSAGLFEAGLKEHKVLFCETIIGKKAIARQLAPSVYIESHPEVVNYIAAHVPHLAYVAAAPDAAAITPLRPNTTIAASLSSYATDML